MFPPSTQRDRVVVVMEGGFRLFRIEAEVVSRWLRHSLRRREGWSEGEKEEENDGEE